MRASDDSRPRWGGHVNCLVRAVICQFLLWCRAVLKGPFSAVPTKSVWSRTVYRSQFDEIFLFVHFKIVDVFAFREEKADEVFFTRTGILTSFGRPVLGGINAEFRS